MSYRVFDEYYEEYDDWYRRNRVIAENEVEAVRRLLEGGRILEIGVGTGFFASRLGVEHGVDPALRPLFLARVRGIEVVQGLGELLPYRDSSFDGALLIVTLCFLEDPLSVLREAWRVLREGGYLVACIVPRDSAWGRFYEERKRRRSVFYAYARFYTVREVEGLLSAAGFRVEEYSATLRTPPWKPPQEEEPSPDPSGRGFICLKARRAALSRPPPTRRPLPV